MNDLAPAPFDGTRPSEQLWKGLGSQIAADNNKAAIGVNVAPNILIPSSFAPDHTMVPSSVRGPSYHPEPKESRMLGDKPT